MCWDLASLVLGANLVGTESDRVEVRGDVGLLASDAGGLRT
jgi:hypothetical protein